MVAVHNRGNIGLRLPNQSKLALRSSEMNVNKLGYTIHHTGFGGTLFKPDPLVRLRGIQAYHMDTLGYGDIAYEGAWDADGNVFLLRDSRWLGAHAYGSRRGGNNPNRYTDGIVYLEDSRKWTSAASQALNWWLDLFRLVMKRPAHLFAHEWWSLTACPESYLIDVVRFCGGSY